MRVERSGKGKEYISEYLAMIVKELVKRCVVSQGTSCSGKKSEARLAKP